LMTLNDRHHSDLFEFFFIYIISTDLRNLMGYKILKQQKFRVFVDRHQM
jgi:hypothetical protein